MGAARNLWLIAGAGLATAVLLLVNGCATGSGAGSPGALLNGTIQTTEESNHRLTVAPLRLASAPMPLQWDDRSRFWANGFRVDPTFLQTGDIVRIHYGTNSGAWTVRHLYLQTHRTVH